ncbi:MULTISPECIES: hypothetical protein [unclassified Mycobacterium avium complex (MAC)]|uniref:hypothetical protein n=1 Tax=unclassified Mycobacterium avium complex (MAC) TaxID=2750822 RepID=UPI0012DC6D26|nr:MULTISPECIES: hypothetical protein [unclassified Mycobacterium avium complex (MAC)]
MGGYDRLSKLRNEGREMQPGWRFWRISGEGLLRSPFLWGRAYGPMVTVSCDHLPKWGNCQCGLYFFPRLASLFEHDYYGAELRGRTAKEFALTFGVVGGRCWPDPCIETALRAERYRILAVVTSNAAVDSLPLRGRYGCQVVAGASRKHCREIETLLRHRLAELADEPLPESQRLVEPLSMEERIDALTRVLQAVSQRQAVTSSA